MYIVQHVVIVVQEGTGHVHCTTCCCCTGRYRTCTLYNMLLLLYRKVTDIYVPLFTILEFIFYFGWLKVHSTLKGKSHISGHISEWPEMILLLLLYSAYIHRIQDHCLLSLFSKCLSAEKIVSWIFINWPLKAWSKSNILYFPKLLEFRYKKTITSP